MSQSLRSNFKPQAIDAGLIQALKERVTFSSESECISNMAQQTNAQRIFHASQPLHPFFKRSVVTAHRDFDLALGGAEKVFLYTGRGPSTESMHLGHLVPFLLTKYLHRLVFPQSPLVIQMADDEKYLNSKSSLEDVKKYTDSNLRDILALDFDKERTFLFKNTEYVQKMYPTVLRIQKSLTINAVSHTFGLEGSDCAGKFLFPAMQAAPCFAQCFDGLFNISKSKWRALVPCALDQDPFFVLARQIAKKLNHSKPSILHCGYVPSLKNISLKMSSSKPEHGVIFMTDSRETIQKKIKGAHSGGHPTLEEFLKKGGNLSTDVPYQLLKYFLEDDEEYEEIGRKYVKAQISSGAIKSYTADLISDVIQEWQERRASIAPHDIEYMQSIRSIEK
ncbi:tryptophanyl-tRNA synthetase [Perkinsela sp. CCAP 1560/4]|nr:tryptophanyl-tRNA synthetase [Perkinsela sp. CCAP 1560/4]|eukprot:KNH09457.1 tryptophanyl-tRNA synthetase [Perkinsela sp. CCAP 1560/4]